jgi:hypothetical protein
MKKIVRLEARAIKAELMPNGGGRPHATLDELERNFDNLAKSMRALIAHLRALERLDRMRESKDG